MGNVTKFVKYKLFKTSIKEPYFENFRKVQPLANGPNKGEHIA